MPFKNKWEFLILLKQKDINISSKNDLKNSWSIFSIIIYRWSSLKYITETSARNISKYLSRSGEWSVTPAPDPSRISFFSRLLFVVAVLSSINGFQLCQAPKRPWKFDEPICCGHFAPSSLCPLRSIRTPTRCTPTLLQKRNGGQDTSSVGSFNFKGEILYSFATYHRSLKQTINVLYI